MALLLGVDTGGTYTDAVLIHDEQEVIASAKALTTRHDLSMGIGEAIAAVLAESGAKAEDLAALEAAVAEMEAALAAQDLDRWAASDDAFHRALLAAQDNRRLEGIALSLYDQAHRARVITLRMRGEGLAQSTADHREILTHIQRGDGPGARRVFRSHRKRAARELLHILETYKLGQL